MHITNKCQNLTKITRVYDPLLIYKNSFRLPSLYCCQQCKYFRFFALWPMYIHNSSPNLCQTVNFFFSLRKVKVLHPYQSNITSTLWPSHFIMAILNLPAWVFFY